MAAKAPTLRGVESLRPFSRSVKHPENLDPLFLDPIGNEVSGMQQYPFARSWHAPAAPHVGMPGQKTDGLIYC